LITAAPPREHRPLDPATTPDVVGPSRGRHRAVLWPVSLFVLLGLPALLLLAGLQPNPRAVMVIDPGVRYRTISGWEATTQAGQVDSAASPIYKEQLFDQAAYDLGLTRPRLEVRSGLENPTDHFGRLLAGQISYKEDNGAHYYRIDDADPQQPSIIMGWRTQLLRQYFRYIRPGAVRIGSSTSAGTEPRILAAQRLQAIRPESEQLAALAEPALDPLAFINADGTHGAVVKATRAGSIRIEGLPFGSYGQRFTSRGSYDLDLGTVAVQDGAAVETRLPQAGVLTVYGLAGGPAEQ
jgi:hypothetical protein